MMIIYLECGAIEDQRAEEAQFFFFISAKTFGNTDYQAVTDGYRQ